MAVNTTLPVRQITFRSLALGAVLGSLLALANLNTGLETGLGFNMSITAAVLAFAIGVAGAALLRGTRLSPLEVNITQTTASSAAYVSMAGLIAPIPAYTLMTGESLSWIELSSWTFSVCCVGILAGAVLRKQLIEDEGLPFAIGVATATTIEEMRRRSSDAIARTIAFLASGTLAAAVTVARSPWFRGKTDLSLSRIDIPGSIEVGKKTVSLGQLTFALDPSLLLVGVGGIVGSRIAISVMLGAVLSWGFTAPLLVSRGALEPPSQEGASWAGSTSMVSQFLLWPGVALMVVSSLVSFALSSGTAISKTVKSMRHSLEGGSARMSFLFAGLITIASIVLQIAFFDISFILALIAVVSSLAMTLVAARVTGEIGISPSGPLGKVSQLLFGAIAPHQIVPNLMAANVTAGAASQCADLMHDLKAGKILGASPRCQIIAQLIGALAGSLVGPAAYLLLVPDPKTAIESGTWSLPAARIWQSVAEVMQKGTDALPPHALGAIVIASVLGTCLSILGKALPKSKSAFVPSPAALSLGFILPAWQCTSIFVGGLFSWITRRLSPSFATRFVAVLAAGAIAGESLCATVIAIIDWLGSMDDT